MAKTSFGERGVQIEWRGKEVEHDVLQEVSRRLDKAAIIVENSAKQSMTEAKSGMAMGKFTRRSAPGEAPASQHGDAGLLGSITHDAPSELVRRVGTNLNYGRWLEEGTTKMAARPWLEVALTRETGKIRDLFRG